MEIDVKIKDLHFLDNALQEIREELAAEIAKGDKADSQKLFTLCCKVNALMHGNDAATQRKVQFDILHESDDTSQKLTKKMSNKLSLGMLGTTGAIDFLTAVTMTGLQLAGIPAETIQFISTTVQAFNGGLGKLNGVIDKSDDAAKQELNTAIQRFQMEIQDKSSTNQSSKNNELNSLKQVQDADHNSSAKFSAIVAGMR